jgi:hypothetical protein
MGEIVAAKRPFFGGIEKPLSPWRLRQQLASHIGTISNFGNFSDPALVDQLIVQLVERPMTNYLQKKLLISSKPKTPFSVRTVEASP